MFSYLHHRQWITNHQLVIQQDLDMIDAELLKLHAGIKIDVGHVPFELFQFEINVRFRNNLGFVYAENSGMLAELADPAAQPVQTQSFKSPTGRVRAGTPSITPMRLCMPLTSWRTSSHSTEDWRSGTTLLDSISLGSAFRVSPSRTAGHSTNPGTRNSELRTRNH
jgi:hypothetical protein